jgi:DNA-binding winged helix-turn-helix (wHTH) protein
MGNRFSPDDLPMEGVFPHARDTRPVDLAHARPFRIGSVEVRPATREVLGGNRREVLEPRVMQVLVALADARGEILSRDDLIASCWEGRAVSDDAINRVLSRLRALARNFEDFQVETIIKVGYRLVESADEGIDLPSLAARSRPHVPRIDRRLLIAGGGAAAVGLSGGAWLLTRSPAAAEPEVARLMRQAEAAMRDGMPDAMTRAAALYRLALEKDPSNAGAWGSLARIYRFQWEFGDPADAAAMAGRARSAAARALELDRDNGDALAAQAALFPMFGNWARAEAEMRQVLPRHPGPIRIRLARLLSDTGRLREALVLVEQAVAAEPDVPRYQNFYAGLLWGNGRMDEAERVLDSALAQWPRHVLPWFMRFLLLAYTGRPRAALALSADHASRPIGVPDERFEFVESMARALAPTTGKELDDAIARVLASVPQGAVYAMEAVIFLSAVGRLDEAFHIAEAYYFGSGQAIADIRLPQTGSWTARDNRESGFLFAAPAAPLRADLRFAALTREIGLDAFWRRTGTEPDYRRGRGSLRA